MEILFVTAQLSPYSLASEVGDIAAALPKALRGLGHKVTVVSPLYAGIDPSARSLARRLSTLNVSCGGKSYACTLFDGRTTGGVDLVFLGNAELFGSRHAAEGTSDEQALSAVVLSAAAAQLAIAREPRIDVLHALDAASALTLGFAKQARPELPCVLNLNASQAPQLRAEQADHLELPEALRAALGVSSPSFLAAGVRFADKTVLGSSSAISALTSLASGAPASAGGHSEHPDALSEALRERRDQLVGIVNGVDASVWNPLTDSHLSARFDPVSLDGKARCKGALQYAFGLPVRPDVPVIAAIGELSTERGGDLIASAAEALRHVELQLLVLGSDSPSADRLAGLATELPERIALVTNVNDKQRHLALAGADFLLLPARAERGLDVALCALRYGTLPIVRAVGALHDSIVDCDAGLQTGNGFVCESEELDELTATIKRAMAACSKDTALATLRKRVMRTDVSWERSARRYEHGYRQLKQANASAA